MPPSASPTRQPGPWKKWRIRTRHGRAIRFIETYCRAPKGTGHRHAAQARDVPEGVPRGGARRRGRRRRSSRRPRGNGKSSGGGALATWALFDDDETGAPQVPIVATTIGQAIRSCYGVAVSMIKAEPELLRRSLIYTGIATPRVVGPVQRGRAVPDLATTPTGSRGSTRSLAIMDEIGFQPIESVGGAPPGGRQTGRGRSSSASGRPDWTARTPCTTSCASSSGRPAASPASCSTSIRPPTGCDIDDREAWKAANPAIGAGFLRDVGPRDRHRDHARGPLPHLPPRPVGRRRRFVARAQRAGHLGRPRAPYDFVAGAPTWVGRRCRPQARLDRRRGGPARRRRAFSGPAALLDPDRRRAGRRDRRHGAHPRARPGLRRPRP